MTVYCYDTEFLEDGTTIDLISIGIVCEDGREYYAVNHDADWNRIEKDDWLMTNVIPHLPTRRAEKPYKFENRTWIWGLDMSSVLIKPKWVIANEVREFLLASVTPARPSGVDGLDDIPAGGYPELWAYYGAYDHIALMQLWGKMIHRPEGLPMWTHDLMQLIEPLTNFQKPAQDGAQHDALADARWNMKLLNAARSRIEQ